MGVWFFGLIGIRVLGHMTVRFEGLGLLGFGGFKV